MNQPNRRLFLGTAAAAVICRPALAIAPNVAIPAIDPWEADVDAALDMAVRCKFEMDDISWMFNFHPYYVDNVPKLKGTIMLNREFSYMRDRVSHLITIQNWLRRECGDCDEAQRLSLWKKRVISSLPVSGKKPDISLAELMLSEDNNLWHLQRAAEFCENTPQV